MRIVIADAHQVFAEALTSLLRRAGHEIVGFATALDAAAAIVEREQVDACVMDISLPGAGVPGAVARVTARAQRTAFVVLAESADVQGLAGMLGAGVRGVALKSDEFIEILRVMTGATSSRASSRGAVLSMAAQTSVSPSRRSRSADDRAQFLTQRELEALARLVRGQSTTAIARSMGVRVSTARSHVDAVLTKLGAHSRLEAVAYAVREGLVDIDWSAGDWDGDASHAIGD
jgi:two-component system nitrate/nitrite response regulator NarL